MIVELITLIGAIGLSAFTILFFIQRAVLRDGWGEGTSPAEGAFVSFIVTCGAVGCWHGFFS